MARIVDRAPYAPKPAPEPTAEVAQAAGASPEEDGEAPPISFERGVGDAAEDADDMPRPERPPVVLKSASRPTSVDEFYALVVRDCLESIARFARDRVELAVSERARAEEKTLQSVDAIAAAGRGVVREILEWWRAELEFRGPYSSWAASFALGTFAEPDALCAVKDGLVELPLSAEAHATMAAEALAVAPSEHVPVLARDLLRSAHPISRAVGVEVLSLRQAISPDELAHHLSDVNVVVTAAAARAAGRLDREAAAPLIPRLKRWMHFPHQGVAWAASRALLRWGLLDPYLDIIQGGRLAAILGVKAGEILILAGNEGDAEQLGKILAKEPISPAHLATLSRFGHAGSWAYLLHALGKEELATSAADALRVLFGPKVPDDRALDAGAWRSAIHEARPTPGTRYRRGEPYRPAVVAAECQSGALTRGEIERRLDELAVRAGVVEDVDFTRFAPDVDPMLASFCAAATAADRSYLAGRW
jgi:hypothetical protein